MSATRDTTTCAPALNRRTEPVRCLRVGDRPCKVNVRPDWIVYALLANAKQQ